MAFNLFKKKNKEPKRPIIEEPKVEAATETEISIPAPVSPVLRSFHVSEKATRAMAYGQYTFIVDPKATKSQVRDAVKQSYKVDVVAVKMVSLPKKERTLGRHKGTIAGKKKAVVVLKEGQSIAAAQP